MAKKKPKCLMTYPICKEDIDVTQYFKLIIKVFNHNVSRFGPWLKKHKEDVVQAGYIGLIKAKSKYEPKKGSFLGLAWLRIDSAIKAEVATLSRYHMNHVSLEDIGYSPSATATDKLPWEEMFSGDILDYGIILRMVKGEDHKKLLYGIIEMYPYWKLRAILGETKEEHDAHVLFLKSELLGLLATIHPNLQVK